MSCGLRDNLDDGKFVTTTETRSSELFKNFSHVYCGIHNTKFSQCSTPLTVNLTVDKRFWNQFNKPYTQSLEEEGRGVEDERSERQRTDKDSRNPTTRTSPTDASVDLQRVIWILTATPQTVIHNQESLIDPTRIRMFLDQIGIDMDQLGSKELKQFLIR
ncbi:hypothetical protein BY996DRAFT_6471355 [Phakopsora pachyrhizi]|nr:hypothetical protein BY996DRAFT_6471355 [Phakopsora pachyrhizi]